MLMYLDASAIVKLVRPEPQTRALFEYLRASPERVSSVISSVEVPRALRRVATGDRAVRRAERVLARIGLVELDGPIRDRAAALGPTGLRTLDAIHLATALDLGDDVGVFVTYDERQLHAGRDCGLEVSSPGN